MKQGSSKKGYLARRILSGALSLAVVLSGVVTAAIPTRAAGVATTHYEFVATPDADANFAELQPNLTVGAKVDTYNTVRSNKNATFYTQDGLLQSVRLFQLYNWVGTRGPIENADGTTTITNLTNKEQVNDPDYHYGLTDRAGGGYRTYCSDDLYKGVSTTVTYYKAPTVNLEMIPKSFQPLDTTDIEAANLSLIIAAPMSAGNTMNVAFDRRLQVAISLDGTTWESKRAGIRSVEFLGGGKVNGSTTGLQLFRIETDDLLDIDGDGVKCNTIQAIKVLPEGTSDCSRSNFYINQMQVNTYETAGDFNTLCPEEVIETSTYTGNDLRKIALAEALRVTETQWKTEEEIISVSPSGSSAVDSSNNAKYFTVGTTYRAPIYDRESDASREQYWSQFINDEGLTWKEHSMSVTLPGDASATTISVQAPSNAVYSTGDYVWQKGYKNVKDRNDVVQEKMNGYHPYGMDCQTLVFNSVSRISRTSAVGAAGTLGAIRTRIVQPDPSSPAPEANKKTLKLQTHPIYTDMDIAKQNSEQQMYESYAAAQPGDIAVHNLSNHVCNVHTRLVRSVSVKRNSDGTINGSESKMYFLEQAGGDPAKMKDGATTTSTTPDYYSTARSNSSQTFASLLNVGNAGGSYVIYTLNEYQDGVVENAKVEAIASPQRPNTNFWDSGLHLSFNANYRIISHQVTLKNNNGTVLYDTGVEYPVNPCATGINYTNNMLDAYLVNLSNGTYTVTLTANTSRFKSLEEPSETTSISKDFTFTVTGRNVPCTTNHSSMTSLSAAGSLASKSYALAGDISGTITVPSGVTATLCLNGHSITGTIQVNGTLTLCNCTGFGYVTGTGDASAISISGGTLNLHNGVIVTNKGVVTKGGGVYMSGGAVNMKGGAITGCTVEGSESGHGGGGVYVTSGTFTMTGGIITGNTATGTKPFGAGVFVNGGKMVMEGGAICENTGSNGSGVYIAYNGNFAMSGGAVMSNTGHAVYLLAKNTISQISGGYISGSGTSAVLVGAAERKATLSGDVIVSGNVDSYGIVTIEDGTVNGNVIANVTDSGEVGNVNITGEDVIITGNITGYGAVTMDAGTVHGSVTATPHKRTAKTTVDGKEISYVTAVNEGSVVINGGSVGGQLIEKSEEIAVYTTYPDEYTTATYTGKLTVTGGKFSAAMSYDDLLSFVPVETGEIYSIKDCSGLSYEVIEGLWSGAEEKFMDFRSSLDFGVRLNADFNFDPYAFAAADSNYTASATSQYGKEYGVSFDVTTIPGVLILWAHGIAAKEMQDDITFKVTDSDGKVLFNETWSVYDVAELWHGDEDTRDQTMLADMINYGNEARKAFKYQYTEGDELPTLTGGTTEEPVWRATSGAGVTNDQRKNVAVTLSLKDQIELNIYVNDKAAEISNVKFNGMYYDDSNYNRDVNSGSYTRFTFHSIPVVKAKGALEFDVTMSSSPDEKFTVKYGIVDYALLAVADETNSQRDLIVALQKYVDSVYRYFGADVEWVYPDAGDDETGPVGLPTIKSN